MTLSTLEAVHVALIMAGADTTGLQDLWGQPFESLYEALAESAYSVELPTRTKRLLQPGLLGFKDPSPDALAFLQRDGSLNLPCNKSFPVTATLLPVAVAASQYLVSRE